jgi:hypothetical protein
MKDDEIGRGGGGSCARIGEKKTVYRTLMRTGEVKSRFADID